MEEWRDIKGFDGYQVSNFGNVRTHNKITSTSLYPVRHWKDRILKPKGQTYATGYRVSLWKNGKEYDFLVARLVAFTFYGEDINNHYLTVNHIDGNRFNNKLENLELISRGDNIRHGYNTGLYPAAKKTVITYKRNGDVTEHRSMAFASLYIGYGHSYIAQQIKKGRYENEDYSWRIV